MSDPSDLVSVLPEFLRSTRLYAIFMQLQLPIVAVIRVISLTERDRYGRGGCGT